MFATGGASGLVSTRYQELSLFASVMKLVRENYVEEVDETKLVRGAVRGLLADLDPHSSYLDPESHREMQVDTRGEFHGLGIEIMKRARRLHRGRGADRRHAGRARRAPGARPGRRDLPDRGAQGLDRAVPHAPRAWTSTRRCS